MNNEITINGYTIPDSQIIDGNIILNNSMICDELSADEASFEITYNGPALIDGYLYSNQGDQLFSSEGDALMSLQEQNVGLDPNSIQYGATVVYKHKGNVIGKFYVKSVEQTAKNRWAITAQSAIGVLINQEHNGGIYSVSHGDTIKSVIDEIMTGLNISYTVSNQIKSQFVAGHLPVASCRDNLLQLCFAFGISIMKDANGDLVFDYNEPSQPEAILPDSRIYLGGKKTRIMPVSKATIYEHAFYAVTSIAPVILFDNTNDVSANNQKIIFENPVIVSTITTTGTITISESNANYAIVTGVGTVQGVEYTHTIKVLEENTGITTVENKEVVYRDATLVNALNSDNCLKRVANYYSTANEVDYDIVVVAERPGEMLQYPDPFTDEQKTGLIKQMSIDVSGILKSATKLTEGWLPNHLGNNYTDYELITSGASWTADKTGTVRIYLVGGGQGGHGGTNGSAGTRHGSTGGAGGAAGNGGNGGNIYVIELEVVSGQTYTISIGSGGAGGGAGVDGSNGGVTTITVNGVTYSSASGGTSAAGIINQFTGDVFALPGGVGVAGAAGGRGGQADGQGASGSTGEDITYEGVTYKGGNGGGYSYYDGDARPYAHSLGGGGGGAAVGGNGGDGTKGTMSWDWYGQQSYHWGAEGGNGGRGGDAMARTAKTLIGGGGDGGHGGGGGGSSGAVSGITTDWDHNPGAGGNGGTGGQGAPGFIMIYK